MGQQAMLVIDGQTRVVPVGSSHAGVKVLAIGTDSADVEVGGKRRRLHVGAQPIQLAAMLPATAGREIVLAAGRGGHFFAQGVINGQSIPFMVDTGASVIAMSTVHAKMLRIDLTTAKHGLANTANGTVVARSVTLRSVRVGDVEVANVEAIVLPTSMEHILLGNSFLSRFSMVRENDVMRLTKR